LPLREDRRFVQVAFGTDEHTALTDAVRAELEARGHTVVAVDDGQWVEVGHAVGEAVANGECDSGVLFCWTGTGASIAANKVVGVRAALCTDAATAAGARTWNDANVLVMGLRLTSPEVATEMVDAWFATSVDPGEREVIATLEET
jgi:ribose 5-phosphate isomerase B